MSQTEYFIWHLLGYAAIPAIFFTGFAVIAAICIFILSLTKDKKSKKS